MADSLYDYVTKWWYESTQTLKSFREAEQLGLKVSALVGELMDEEVAVELKVALMKPIVENEEIERAVDKGGLGRV